MSQEHNLTPAEGRTPEELIDGPMVRRLCIINYQCPLCRLDHEAELYISLPATDLDEYVTKLREQTQDWHSLEPALTEATVHFHTTEGDLAQLVENTKTEGIPATRPPTIELTSESAYTCDDCSRTFKTIGALREHMGKGP